MIKKLLAAVLIWGWGFGNAVFGQKESAFWYFGTYAGLDFNSGSPITLINGMLATSEGCSSISDATGNLLFYTDGVTIWDRNHSQMPNGDSLDGGESSTQSALIVPMPGNSLLYYIFTVEQLGVSFSGNFSYSIVNMSLNGGNGDVVIKNNLIDSMMSEKLTAVKHSNGTDIWVMVHDLSDGFHAYLLTSTGLNTVPIISNVGINIIVGDAAGYMKFSPDGNKIAFAAPINNYVDLFDFNSNTGIVTNEKYLPLPSSNFSIEAYGLEFSCSGNYLYTAVYGSQSIYQWDISSNSAPIINSTIQLIYNDSSNDRYGALQMAIDGKIYLAAEAVYLGVINNPELPGLACNFVDSAVSLGGFGCIWGLPNILTSYFLPTGINTNNSQQNQLTISPNPASDKIYISFPATASENITVKIYSVTGENLFHPDNYRDKTLEKVNTAIDITGFSNGIYFLSVQTGREVVTKKIIVNH